MHTCIQTSVGAVGAHGSIASLVVVDVEVSNNSALQKMAFQALRDLR